MLYFIARSDATSLHIASDIDPAYAKAFIEASRGGVEVLAMDCHLSPDAIEIGKGLPSHHQFNNHDIIKQWVYGIIPINMKLYAMGFYQQNCIFLRGDMNQLYQIDHQAIKIYDEAAFEKMRVAGNLAARTLDFITPHVIPGVSTAKLDSLCHAYILENGASPAPLNYRGFQNQFAPRSIMWCAMGSQTLKNLMGRRYYQY